jgi:hypothetical protein
MPDAFKLTVPVAAEYQALLPEVAKRYAELSGAGPADGVALAEALRAAVGLLINGATGDASLVLEFRQSASGVEIAVRCGGRSTSIAHPLPTRSKP